MSTERPSGFPHPQDPLLEAARYNDAAAEEHGLPQAALRLGLDLSTLTHIAEQRAMRAMLVKKGRLAELKTISSATSYQALRFSNEEQVEIALIASCYIDGIALGWKARELREPDA